MSKRINEDRMMELFYAGPKEYHVREVARLCDVSPPTASKYLDRFAEQGLLQKEESRGNLLFSPNRDSKEFTLRKKIWMIERIHESGLISYLEREMAYPAIILFGSVARGEDTTTSDIDLFIVADMKKKINLEKYEGLLGREIQLFVHTKEEFEKMKEASPELLNNVINGVILSGYFEVFS